ncbi:MAG: histidinol-phosphatase [Marinilabiliales bacterium]|nr:MAG: histidinol-phosphatase [Marinilabiliales bacterium]
MKYLFAIGLVGLALSLSAQNFQRNEIKIPDIPGYLTLKCDFHLHTYYSDGEVSPESRVREAWIEGLDAIALSDHLEGWRFKDGEDASRNKPFEDAKEMAQIQDIILIRGIELTKGMPPGHFNLLFLHDADKIHKKNYKLALQEAKKQGAFILWNHPGWKQQAPDGAVWYNEHTEIYNNGWMHGIEVSSWGSFYPEAMDWALEKDLAVVGNTDSHIPMNDFLSLTDMSHRTMSIVFAKERTAEGIKEALLDKRSVVWNQDKIIGRKDIVEQLVKECISIKSVIKINKYDYYVQLYNNSDFNFLISLVDGNGWTQKVFAGNTIRFYIKTKEVNELKLRFENVIISSDEVLETVIKI